MLECYLDWDPVGGDCSQACPWAWGLNRVARRILDLGDRIEGLEGMTGKGSRIIDQIGVMLEPGADALWT